MELTDSDINDPAAIAFARIFDDCLNCNWVMEPPVLLRAYTPAAVRKSRKNSSRQPQQGLFWCRQVGYLLTMVVAAAMMAT
jgi:hypothetical protein